MIQIAFYKGQGGTFNRLIRWWTGSQFTHVELIINGTWYSSSHTDGGVRAKVINGNSGNWEIYDLPEHYDELYALSAFNEAIGKGYDWTGIVGSQILPFGIQWPWHYFCSELVGKMLGVKHPHRYAPHELQWLIHDKEET